MLLHDLVLGLLLLEGTLFAQVCLLLSSQSGGFLPVQRLLVKLLLQGGMSVLD